MKLEELFAKKSFIHSILVGDKKNNENSIPFWENAIEEVKAKDDEYLLGYYTAIRDSLIQANKDIKRRIKIEMGVM